MRRDMGLDDDMRLKHNHIPWFITHNALQGNAYSGQTVLIAFGRGLYRVRSAFVFPILICVVDHLVYIPVTIGEGCVVYAPVLLFQCGASEICMSYDDRSACT